MLQTLELKAPDMLARVTRDALVRLTRVNVFVGPNGSGKSTYLDAFRTLVLKRNVNWTTDTAPLLPTGECQAVLFVSSEFDNPRLFAKRDGDGRQVSHEDLQGHDLVVMLTSKEVSHGQSNYKQMQAFMQGDAYDVIVLDEPENALDMDGVLWLYHAIKGSTKQVILATHNPLLMALANEPDGSAVVFGQDPGYAERVAAVYKGVLSGGKAEKPAARMRLPSADGEGGEDGEGGNGRPAGKAGRAARKGGLVTRKPRSVVRA